MKPPCHTSSQVKHKQSQQQLLKVIKLIKNFAALLLYANLHSLTHPPTPLPPLITNLSRLNNSNNSNNKDNNNNNNDDDTRTPHNVTKLIMLKRRSSTLRQRRRKFSWSESLASSCVRVCVIKNIKLAWLAICCVSLPSYKISLSFLYAFACVPVWRCSLWQRQYAVLTRNSYLKFHRRTEGRLTAFLLTPFPSSCSFLHSTFVVKHLLLHCDIEPKWGGPFQKRSK